MRPDWIEGFLQYTEAIRSPRIFRQWAAISAVAAALERKVWVRTAGSRLYPNLYIILVGPAGIGKTEPIWRVREFVEELEDHYVAPSSVTKASLIDELNEATRRWVIHNPQPGQNPVDSFNSLLLCVNELGVLIPAYENEFMNTLTDLWDCKNYSESRRTRKIEIDIPRPQLNLIGGCTPSYLASTLPEGAWDQGFLSRTMLVFSAEETKQSLFTEEVEDNDARKSLLAQFESIANLYGQFKFEEKVKELLDDFHLNGGPERVSHPKLITYNTRRTVHLLKLCQVAAASRADELVIREEDFQRGLQWMLEAEAVMPQIFKSMGQAGTGRVMQEAWHFIYQSYMKEQKPIPKHRLIRFLQERIPVHNIQTTIELMEKGRMIEKQLTTGGECYKPKGKTSYD